MNNKITSRNELQHGTTTTEPKKHRTTIYFLKRNSTKSASARRPVGRFVVPAVCQLVRLRTVRQHRPDLTRAGARGLEHDVAPVRRPAGAFVAARKLGRAS